MKLADTIKATVSVEQYLRDECGNSEFRRKGRETVTVCPLHGDSHPSLRIKDNGFEWYCDPCGEGGTVIDLDMKLHGTDVAGTIKHLSDKYGIEDSSRPAARQRTRQTRPPAKKRQVPRLPSPDEPTFTSSQLVKREADNGRRFVESYSCEPQGDV